MQKILTFKLNKRTLLVLGNATIRKTTKAKVNLYEC